MNFVGGRKKVARKEIHNTPNPRAAPKVSASKHQSTQSRRSVCIRAQHNLAPGQLAPNSGHLRACLGRAFLTYHISDSPLDKSQF